MKFYFKKTLQVLIPLFIVSLSTNAYAIKWVGEIGIHAGGDELATATYTNGDTASIEAGALFSVEVGPQIDITPDSFIRALIGYKFDNVSATNGSIDFDRIPIDVMYFYKTDLWNFGGGLTYHLGPELSGSGVASGINGSFDDALGFVVEVDYHLGDFFYLGGKYTSIDYKPELAGAATVDGSSIGVVMGFIFGD